MNASHSGPHLCAVCVCMDRSRTDTRFCVDRKCFSKIADFARAGSRVCVCVSHWLWHCKRLEHLWTCEFNGSFCTNSASAATEKDTEWLLVVIGQQWFLCSCSMFMMMLVSASKSPIHGGRWSSMAWPHPNIQRTDFYLRSRSEVCVCAHPKWKCAFALGQCLPRCVIVVDSCGFNRFVFYFANSRNQFPFRMILNNNFMN